MMHYTDHNSPMSKQHKVTRLTASFLLLLIGALSIIFVFSALRMGAVVSASQASDSTAAAGATSAANTTKTVESYDPDTGGVVSICVSIGGPDSILDIVLAQDVSLRMRYPVTEGATQTRLAASQQAASAFVNLLTSTDRIAVVPFSNTAYLAQPLTTDKDMITRTIFALTATGNTNISDSIGVGLRELISSSHYASNTIKAIILLSDGQANLPPGTAKEDAREQARTAAGHKVRIYTIGFGSDVDEVLLRDIANISGGRYSFAPDGDALNNIYLTLGTRAACYYLHLPIAFRNWTAPGIVNGDFEYGWTGWITGGELSRSIVSTPTHSGSFSARLGDPAYICQNEVPVGRAWMEQTFTVPYTPTKLEFWYRIFTQDVNPYLSDEFDLFVVKINNTALISDAKRGDNYGCAPQELTDLGWKREEIDLSGYCGQQVTVRFENWNQPDGWYNTWTFVDEVQFVP